ncbi:MAG: xanthine dehydrogenase family protein subunit M, partial [Thermoanaerobaculia bacterium]|nr:xanthine dehydrogenase family protein subunit M [Thermoanaerobaculia bacterium]
DTRGSSEPWRTATVGDRVSSLAEACRRLAEDSTIRPVAGGTDLMVAGAVERAQRGALLDLSGVEALHGIERVEEELVVGAATTFSQLRQDPEVQEHFPALAAAAAEVGGWQIQNRATLGGNVANASPAGDSLPVLLVLQAKIDCCGLQGERTLAYNDFHTGYRKTALQPGELIARFRLPIPAPGVQQGFRKVGTREAQAISKVVLAMAGRVEAGRIVELRLAAGSVAATPIRLRAAEAAAMGKVPSEGAPLAAAAARQETEPIADVRSSAEYRSVVLGRLVQRWVASLADER